MIKFSELLSLKIFISFVLFLILQIITWYFISKNSNFERHFIELEIIKNDKYLRELNFNISFFEDQTKLILAKISNESYSPMLNSNLKDSFYDFGKDEKFDKTFATSFLISEINENIEIYLNENNINFRSLGKLELKDLIKNGDSSIENINNIYHEVFFLQQSEMMDIINDLNKFNFTSRIEILNERLDESINFFDNFIISYIDQIPKNTDYNEQNVIVNDLETLFFLMKKQYSTVKPLISSFKNNYEINYVYHNLPIRNLNLKYLYVILIINFFIFALYLLIKLGVKQNYFKS